jgi:NAD(P)-dependent dehydrogenase (short-subunit alcohol dehydrogenase family)
MKLSLSRLIGSITLFTCLFSPLTIAEETPGTVLITGANRGIGLALAQQFTDAGFRVIGTARNPAGAEDLAATGARVEQLDVTDSESVNALASRIADLPIDIVINNAGVGGEDSKNLAELDVDAIMTTLDVNTLGPLRVIKALYPNVVAGQRKVFANISSMMGSNELNTWGCCAGYRASKAALNAINTTLAVDFAEDGMTFVVLHPGYVQTDMNEGRGNITPEQSAEGLLAVISALDAKDNGKYYDWQGKELPW